MPKKKGNKPIAIDGIHLWRDERHVYVEVDINGTWHKVIKELDGNFSHIVEPDGIRDAIRWNRTYP